MKHNKKHMARLLASSLLLLTFAVGCGSDNDDSNGTPTTNNPVPQEEQGDAAESTGPLGAGAQQVERLARPVINEGLVISNDLMNAFNSIPPTADLSPAAAPVLAEAAKVIEATDMIDGKDDLSVAAVTTAFLPDVMRIDTRVNIAPGKPAYNAEVSGDKGILTGGRKIEDDVVDITVSFLVAADPTGKTVKDNVSYEGVAGNQAQPGHKRLYQQSGPGKTASFPFLAIPN